jgi:hypothetical protein
VERKLEPLSLKLLGRPEVRCGGQLLRTLAQEIGLQGELWQIWAAIGELYERRGEPEEARDAFSRAAGIVERLAGEIEDEALKEGFLSAPQLRRVLETSARKP